ncbi:hypothetical protein FPY71_05030 [Aureimonas fodinaquatilis]|uniref:Muramidase n=1 Tax=Aureimonas fodinaquatilis TaxID=2565783 RepID=A0A5B0E1D0_9HYPH|nr:glycoside hydrolase family 25 protein [Aureimonas fodinaquatilis]KAA0972456.1 hypothetical protein FPY71_05030 [Aureimonas fodinaquatilis]
MQSPAAALKAATRWITALAAGAVIGLSSPAMALWNEPWKNADRALVIDAYEFNPIDWLELTSDKRIAGFINKASDGMPPAWSCRGLTGDDENLCKNRWWKYSVTKELYQTRRTMAKQLGLKWGAYHLGRPGNPREQADHFLEFAEPSDDELIAIDIEDNTSEWMSLADAEIFADQIKIRTGRYPVLYTNGSTAAYVDKNRETYPLLSRLPLWYARYRDDITGLFPQDSWPSYALWQFSSMHNCNDRSCPYRVNGAKTDIDVNVSPLSVAELKKAWPFGELTQRKNETEPTLMVSAYNAVDAGRVDPLALLSEAARREHAGKPNQPILSSLTRGPKVDPDMPGDHAPVGMFASLLDSMDRFEMRMRRVWNALTDDVPAQEAPSRLSSLLQASPPLQLASAPRIPEEARSFIIEQMKKAQAAQAAQAQAKATAKDAAVPVTALTDLATERGGRLTGAASALESLMLSGGRVASAFEVTQ